MAGWITAVILFLVIAITRFQDGLAWYGWLMVAGAIAAAGNAATEYIEKRRQKMIVSNGEYTCDMCGGTFETGRSDEEAWAEHDKNFPGESHDTAAVICDECYQTMFAEVA